MVSADRIEIWHFDSGCSLDCADISRSNISSMRQAARIDANQVAIVEALRKAGCTVQSLARIGAGCPDLLVARAGENYLLEIKTDGGVLNKAQLDWIAAWNGQVDLVRSVDGALAVVGLGKKST
jgi:hypothetical protein